MRSGSQSRFGASYGESDAVRRDDRDADTDRDVITIA